ncbi:hypothetical protein TNCV_4293581 [Trichonephila clavipes]|uniref:Uncharacterized protein n=1 Tax=Trichonephila clavipes TaxID=2585209 RepID=A0A8X6RG11_TRICX|nr:hypothetical protein TNCV_4293581 [Trichonephila clavipes]
MGLRITPQRSMKQSRAVVYRDHFYCEKRGTFQKTTRQKLQGPVSIETESLKYNDRGLIRGPEIANCLSNFFVVFFPAREKIGKEKAALLCQEAASLYAVEPVSPFGDWPGARRDDAFLGCLAALIGGSRKGGLTLAFAFAETSDFRGLSF